MTDEKTQQQQQAPTSRRAWADPRRKRFWALVTILLYSLAGFYAVPPITRWALITPIEDTGRSASIQEIRANPFRLSLAMYGAEVLDTDSTRILSYDEYFLNFELSSLFRWAWTFKTVRIAGLYLNEERFDRVDTRFRRFIDAFTEANKSTAKPDDKQDLPRLIIGKFNLINGRISLTDRTAGDYTGQFGPVNVEINDLRTLPNHNGAQSVSITTAAGGQIEWEGDLQLVPFYSSGELRVSGKGLADFYRYADHFLPFAVTGEEVAIFFRYVVLQDENDWALEVSDIGAEALGMRVTLQDDDDTVFAAARISLDGGGMQWPKNQVSLGTLQVDDMQLNAALRADGSVSLEDLLPEWLEETMNAPAAADSIPWTVAIARFALRDATVGLTDESPAERVSITLENLELDLTEIDNNDGTAMPLALNFSLDSGGSIQWGGNLKAFPEIEAQGKLVLENTELSIVQPYLAPLARVQLDSGIVSMTADTFHDPGTLLNLNGELMVSDLDVLDVRRGERLVAWEALNIDRFEASLEPLALETSVIKLQAPYGRLHIDENLQTNVSDLVVTGTEPGGETPAASSPQVTIGGFEIADAAMDFSDFSLPLPFEAAIRDMDGTISALSLQSSAPAELDFEGQVNEFGLARIGGTINVMNPKQQADVSVLFRNLEMARMTPYTVQFAGYSIKEGKLDLDLGYKLANSQLNGQNNIVMRELTLGEKSDHPDAGNLPLSLAVALLKDADGVIDIDLPVEGNVDNPEFRIGGVVLKAIGNLIAKAVTAPFRLLGGLIGVDSEDFGTLRFQPGSAELSPPDREQLGQLITAMEQRPELLLEVSGAYFATLDAPALAELEINSLINEKIDAAGTTEGTMTSEQRRSVIEELYLERLPAGDLAAVRLEYTIPDAADTEAPGVLDELAYLTGLRDRLVASINVSADALLQLADARADEVMGALSSIQPDTALPVTKTASAAVDESLDDEIPMTLNVSADADPQE